MIGHGGDPHFILAKSDFVETPASGQAYVMWHPQDSTAPDEIHVHDPVGGGGISYNAWHSAVLRWNERPVDEASFSRFTVKSDINGSPLEASDGTYQNDEEIKGQSSYVDYGDMDVSDVPRYLGVWQFLYSPDKIEARRDMA